MVSARHGWGRQHWQLSVVIAAVSSVIVPMTACRSGDDQASPTTTYVPPESSAPVAGTGWRDPQAAAPTTVSLPGVSAESSEVVSLVSQRMPVGAAEQACVAARLDANPELRAALGGDPVSSPRFSEVTAFVGDCVRSVEMAPRMASGVVDQIRSVGGAVSEAQAACLVDEFSRLTADEFDGVVAAGLSPDTSTVDQGAPIKDVLAACDIGKNP